MPDRPGPAFPRAVHAEPGALIRDPARVPDTLPADFEGWWELEGEAVDVPNRGRGGWSAVDRIALPGGAPAFLKRQRGYRRRSLRAPLGLPTLRYEVVAQAAFAAAGLRVPRPLVYGEAGSGRDHRALLLLELLPGRPLPSAQHEAHERGPEAREALAREVGEAVGAIHRAGLRHGSLYPKHLLLDPERGIGFLDLERGGPLGRGSRGALADLDRLLRRSCHFGEAEARAFLGAYGSAPDEGLLRRLRRLRERRGLDGTWDARACRCPNAPR